MQIFEKRSFWSMFFLSIITFGVYYIYYYVRTTRQLRRAGNNIPSILFLFLPHLGVGALETIFKNQGLINGFNINYVILICLKITGYLFAYYFWFNYIKAYCRTIKYNSEKHYIWKYFFTFLAASWITIPFSYLFLLYFVELSVINPLIILLIILGFAMYGNLVNYMLFQKGFNQYVAQDPDVEK